MTESHLIAAPCVHTRALSGHRRSAASEGRVAALRPHVRSSRTTHHRAAVRHGRVPASRRHARRALRHRADLFPPSGGVFRGNVVNDNTAVIVAYTLYGDANLDKVVDTVDFNLLASNFSSSVDRWSKGDFNYDGSVDTTDFNLLASNFAHVLPASIDALGAVIPEPSALGLGLAGMTIMFRQRRRR